MTIAFIILALVAMLASAALGAYTWQKLAVAPHLTQRLCDFEYVLGRRKPGEDMASGGNGAERWDRVLRDVMRLRRGGAL